MTIDNIEEGGTSEDLNIIDFIDSQERNSKSSGRSSFIE